MVSDHGSVAPQRRKCAKVLLLSEYNRVLLFHGRDPDDPGGRSWWFCPGGALQPGESFEDAARRELLEETGIRVGNTGPVVFSREFSVAFGGHVYAQLERYFLVRVLERPMQTDRWTESEQRAILGWRWWPAADLEGTCAEVYPEGLSKELGRLIAT